MALTMVPLHAKILSPFTGAAAVGTIEAVVPQALYDAAGNVIWYPATQTATLIAGEATLSVPATDSPTVSPIAWTLTVNIKTTELTVTRHIQVPYTTVGTLELADLPEVTASGGLVSYLLASTLGQPSGPALLDATGRLTYTEDPVLRVRLDTDRSTASPLNAPVDIAGLGIAIPAAGTWRYRWSMGTMVDADNTPGPAVYLNGPTLAAVTRPLLADRVSRYSGQTIIGNPIMSYNDTVVSPTGANHALATGMGWTWVEGTVVVSAAGTLQPRMSRGSTAATNNVTVLAGSYGELARVP